MSVSRVPSLSSIPSSTGTSYVLQNRVDVRSVNGPLVNHPASRNRRSNSITSSSSLSRPTSSVTNGRRLSLS